MKGQLVVEQGAKVLEEGLHLPRSVVPFAVYEERWRTVRTAAQRTFEIALDLLPRRTAVQGRGECTLIRASLGGVARKCRVAQVGLILIQQVVHLPEVSLFRDRFRRFSGGLGVRMDVREGHIAKYQTQRVTELAL